MDRPYLVLIEHKESTAYLFGEVREVGLKVLYMGKNKDLQSIADKFIDINPIQELESYLERHGKELKRMNIIGAYSFFESAKYAEQRLSEYLGLPSLSLETRHLGRDKLAMRNRMKVAGVACPNFSFISDEKKDLTPPLAFPFIVKPNLGYSSAGVRVVRNESEFLVAVQTIRDLNRSVLSKISDQNLQMGALCEDFIEGPEFSVDAITISGKTVCFCVCGRGFPGEDNFQDYVYYTPPRISPALIESLEEEVARVLTAFQYTDGPSHTEVRFDQKNNQWVTIESAFRVGFGGNIGLLYQAASDVKYNQLVIRSVVKNISFEELRKSLRLNQKHAVLFTPSTGQGGLISEVGGIDFLKNDPRVSRFFLPKKAGERVTPYPKGMDYLGFVLGAEKSEEGLDSLIQQITKEVVFHYEKEI